MPLPNPEALVINTEEDIDQMLQILDDRSQEMGFQFTDFLIEHFDKELLLFHLREYFQESVGELASLVLKRLVDQRIEATDENISDFTGQLTEEDSNWLSEGYLVVVPMLAEPGMAAVHMYPLQLEQLAVAYAGGVAPPDMFTQRLVDWGRSVLHEMVFQRAYLGEDDDDEDWDDDDD